MRWASRPLTGCGPHGSPCSALCWGPGQAHHQRCSLPQLLLFWEWPGCLWYLVTSHLSHPGHKAPAQPGSEPGLWAELLWAVDASFHVPHPMVSPQGQVLPASPAFSLAEWAKVSGWSGVFPNLLPGPQAHTPFCQGRDMSRGLRALLVLGESGSWASRNVPPADEVLRLHLAESWGTGFGIPHSTWQKALGEQLGRGSFCQDPEISRVRGHRLPRSAPELASGTSTLTPPLGLGPPKPLASGVGPS